MTKTIIEKVEGFNFDYVNLILGEDDIVHVYYNGTVVASYYGKDSFEVSLKIVRDSDNERFSHYDLLINERYVASFWEIDRYEIKER